MPLVTDAIRRGCDGACCGDGSLRFFRLDVNEPDGDNEPATAEGVDGSGTVEKCVKLIVPRSENERNKNLFAKDPGADIPWLTGTTNLNPLVP